MAYKEIGSYDIYNWEQQEVVENQLIAGEDGVVTEQEVVIQAYAKIQGKVIVSQEVVASGNYSNFKAELWVYATAGEKGDGFTITPFVGYNLSTALKNRYSNITLNDEFFTYSSTSSSNYSVVVNPGETVSNKITSLNLSNKGLIRDDYVSNQRQVTNYHELDGVLNRILFFSDYSSNTNRTDDIGNPSYDIFRAVELATSLLEGTFYVSAKNVLTGGVVNTKGTSHIQVFNLPFPEVMDNDRSVAPITANNFTDEENPAFTYSISNQICSIYDTELSDSSTGYANVTDTTLSLQVALSFDGVTADIAYRDIPIDGSNYTFNLTDAERETLRAKAQGSDNVPIYYLTKVRKTYNTKGHGGEAAAVTLYNATERILTIVGCNPTLNPTVKDIKPETLALTGDENTFIRYESMAEYAINATASKSATIVSQSVQCGSKTVTNLPQGVIDDVESGTFIFNVTDSRGMGASSSVFKNLVEYVKPTCYQKEEIEISGETGANIKVTVNGSYFNGSFGAANNTLKLEVRYTDNNGNMGAWQTLSGTPTYNGTSYKLEATLTGFNYGNAYVFQCRATDKLNVVESSQYTIRMLPVFDWSENDFNFNVPVNIDADNLNMHNETIIRHSEDTNNTVLSSTGGHIYIRPGGTNNTSGQTILYSNGNVDFSGNATFGGTVNFNNSFTIGGYILNDYVIETGSEAMGSNGTWYWRKWASGKAECWGCRNFGNMAVSTAWGNLYRSAIFTQDLPDNVFIRTPDAININFVHAGGAGWISKHENSAPSAITTGSFVVVRPVSGNITPTNIGFHVIGEWY